MTRGWYDDDRDKVTPAPLWQQLLDKFSDTDDFGVPHDTFEAALSPLIPSPPALSSASGSKPAHAGLSTESPSSVVDGPARGTD